MNPGEELDYEVSMPHEEDFRVDADGLRRALELLIEARGGLGSPHLEPAAEVLVPRELPERGLGSASALQLLAPIALTQVARLDHPGFFAHMDPPTPWITWATSCWAAAMNQNLLHPDTAPSARALERAVVEWLASAFGMRGGHTVPGSTIANLTALWAAREVAGVKRVVASSAAHLSIAKAANLLGLKLEMVPVDAEQRLRVDALPEDLSDAALVLVAGTVATGAVDDLGAGKSAAWRHVDAAWAGPLRLSRHAHLLDGIETADSVAVSAHKWLYQPKDSGLIFFANPDAAHRALTFGGSYLAAPNVGILGSHGNVALSLAATLLAWGQTGVAERIEADMELAEALADRIAAEPELELRRRPTTGVLNWRPRSADPEAVRKKLVGAWVSTTLIEGQPWFRSVAANPLAEPAKVVGAVLDAIRCVDSLPG